MADDETDQRTRFIAGLSLGPPGMFTGLAVLEKRYTAGKYGHETDAAYAVRHLIRFAPGTAYAHIVQVVAACLHGVARH